jgi:hypothetical protein
MEGKRERERERNCSHQEPQEGQRKGRRDVMEGQKKDRETQRVMRQGSCGQKRNKEYNIDGGRER